MRISDWSSDVCSSDLRSRTTSTRCDVAARSCPLTYVLSLPTARPIACPESGNSHREAEMHDNVYKIIELAGTSTESIEGAIRNGIAKSAQSLKHLRWFEVMQTRGHIENGKNVHYNVVMKVGFTLQD